MYFLVYRDAIGEHRWSLKAKNHKLIAESGEGYKTLQGGVRAVGQINNLFAVPLPVMVNV